MAVSCCGRTLPALQPRRDKRTGLSHRQRRSQTSPTAVQKARRSKSADVVAIANPRVSGPSLETRPSYTDSHPFDKVMISYFRSKLDSVGLSSPLPGYAGLMEGVKGISRRSKTPQQVQEETLALFKSLFPSWLAPLYRMSFAKLLPKDVENPLFAVITFGAFKWLMGDMELREGETKDKLTKPAHQVFIKRCRFVEEAGCASVCVNSCKIPTQAWLKEDFNVDLRVTPDYEDFSCKFEFGQVPLPEEEDPAFSVPCFIQCPSKAQMRSASNSAAAATDDTTAAGGPSSKTAEDLGFGVDCTTMDRMTIQRRRKKR